MPWLYEHRDKLNGLGHFAEIAYRVTYGTRSPDRDDLEQVIVLAMSPLQPNRERLRKLTSGE